VAHCEAVVQVQKPLLHAPLGPHWLLFKQVPQVPSTQACPPPHWLFAVQAVQTPLMQVMPFTGPRLQSSKVEHAPHTPLTHACPEAQMPLSSQVTHAPR
jgi:hypothetical protein